MCSLDSSYVHWLFFTRKTRERLKWVVAFPMEMTICRCSGAFHHGDVEKITEDSRLSALCTEEGLAMRSSSWMTWHPASKWHGKFEGWARVAIRGYLILNKAKAPSAVDKEALCSDWRRRAWLDKALTCGDGDVGVTGSAWTRNANPRGHNRWEGDFY